MISCYRLAKFTACSSLKFHPLLQPPASSLKPYVFFQIEIAIGIEIVLAFEVSFLFDPDFDFDFDCPAPSLQPPASPPAEKP
jgi:hypothetical protein